MPREHPPRHRSQHFWRPWPAVRNCCAIAFLHAVTASSIVAGNAALCQNFDGPDPLWQLLTGPGRLVAHTCEVGGARSDTGCERAIIIAPVAESTLLACPTQRVAVIDELDIRLWVRASRPDIQLAARIRLPRSIDAAGQAVAAVVRGDTYRRPGHWQQLVMKGVPRLLADEVRILRVGPAAKIDPRQAYVDAVVLVVPGEPSGVELFVDDLEIDGVVLPGDTEVQLASATTVAPAQPAVAANGLPAPRVNVAPAANTSALPAPAAVQLQGSVFVVAGRQFSPRIIEWQNESLAFLAELGFNTVWLTAPPSTELIVEATRHGLWFVCVPPRPDAVARDGVGQPGDRVIAWCLDDEAVELDAEYAHRWANLVRERDAGGSRPLVFLPREEYRPANDNGDAAIVFHPRAARMPGSDLDRWLASQPRLARPGMPLWAAVATQFSDAVGEQAAALSNTLASPPSVDADQIQALVLASCARGYRGFLFRSRSRLDEENLQARHRAAVLALVNRRLLLMEPWTAGGNVVGQLASTDGRWQGALLHVDRARILLPMKTDATPIGSNGVANEPPQPAHAGASREIAFIVPGIPDSSQAYWMTPVAFRRLTVQRVAGGSRVMFPDRGDGMLFLTEDPRVVEMFRQRIARDAAPFAKLQRDVAAQRLASTVEATRAIAQLDPQHTPSSHVAEQATVQLRQCDTLLAAGRADEAQEAGAAAYRNLLQEVAQQLRMPEQTATFNSNPLTVSCDQLLARERFSHALRTMRPAENVLYGGDFEDQGQLTQFGWVHASRAANDSTTTVRLSATRPLHGQYCLEMSAAPRATPAGSAAAPSPSHWIVSPPIPVEEGQVVAITGWVRIDEPIVDSVDGLQIIDSLGGDELAIAVRQTSGWQALEMVRGVPTSTELRLTIALAGAGTACIDGVMIRMLDTPTVRRLPSVLPTRTPSPAAPPVSPATATKAGPLLAAPEAR